MAHRTLPPGFFALSVGAGLLLAGCDGAVIEFHPDAGPGSSSAGADDAGDNGGPVQTITPATLASPSGATVPTSVPGKIDILFDVDNSRSMGDKQAYLQAAIPDLINRLINPNCISATTGAADGASDAGVCPNSGDLPEFRPVFDMHLAMVSSSLGPRGGDACASTVTAQAPFQNVSAHNDDQGHLLNRTLLFTGGGASVAEGTLADAPAADPYLYWFPPAPNAAKVPGPGDPVAAATTLIADVTAMIGGAGAFGCGLESQLESWYRFLIQPDPYQSIGIQGNIGDATGLWTGVDATVIAQRHDFLRPDSIVLIVDLSDENDSEIDVRSIGGRGVNWMAGAFPPPQGTSACASNPGSSSCQSCATGNNDSTDSNCKANPTFTSPTDWGYDLNLRHVHMKAKYGVDPQYPVERYVTGLTSSTVPDRNGEYPSGAAAYVGMNDCQNPLYAGTLPDGSKTDVNSLCHAPPGTRTRDQVFYAHIGGVPSSLLHFDPTSAANSALTDADWVKILGNDPEAYDYTGIDLHMIESYAPRTGLAPAGSPISADPVSGHEWITNDSAATGNVLLVDLQYACIFPLADAKGNAAPRDCTLPQNAPFCDCPFTQGSVPANDLPPVCNPTTETQQVAAKAYPTVRELLLAHKLGSQGIVSSICPQKVADNATGDDPLYGYRPAVGAIMNQMKAALGGPCFPVKLNPVAQGGVACNLLVQIPGTTAAASGSCLNPTCNAAFGLVLPEASLLKGFCQSVEEPYQQQVAGNNGTIPGLVDPASIPTCELEQLVASGNPTDFSGGTCAAAGDKGWCYVSGAGAAQCAQEIAFSPNAIPYGATAHLLCSQ